MKTYDVFITCKSEDYGNAEKIYDFLTENGLKVFLASRELRRLGESEYRKAISSAMQQAYHLIIFASKAEYIDSTWVYYEWDMFVNAKLKGYKPGNIVTILKGVKTDEINMDLWKYESLTFESFEESILRYVQTPQSIENKKRIEEEKKKKEEERLRKEAEAHKQKAVKNELIETAEEYQKRKAALSVDVSKIRALLESLKITTVKCPVCGSGCSVNDTFCGHCGWQLSLLSGIEEIRYLDNVDPKQLEIHRKLYANAAAAGSDESLELRVKQLENENAMLEKDIKAKNEFALQVQDKSIVLQTKIEQKDALLKKIQEENSILQKKAEEHGNMADALLNENSVLKDEIDSTKKQAERNREKANTLQKELAYHNDISGRIQRENSVLKGRIADLEASLKLAAEKSSQNSRIHFGEWALIVITSFLTPVFFIYWMIVFATRINNERLWNWNMRHKGLMYVFATIISMILLYGCVNLLADDEYYQEQYYNDIDSQFVVEDYDYSYWDSIAADSCAAAE